jgi:hypothetical protein
MYTIGRTPEQADAAAPVPAGGLDFDWRVEVEAAGPQSVEAEVEISVPLVYVWFAARGEMMETVLDLRLEVMDPDDTLIWEHEQAISLEVEESALTDDPDMRHREVITLRIEGQGSRFSQGTYRIFALLVNRTGEARIRKVKTFKLDQGRTR